MGRYGCVESLTKEQAERIKVLRTGQRVHSWRRIAEVFCDEFPDSADKDLYGNQLYGIELCEVAADTLGISREDYDKEWM